MNIRQLTLPDLNFSYVISKEQVYQYQENGHILLRSVASPEEISIYKEVIDQAK